MIESWVGDFGYLGIFVLAFLENFFPPLPSEIIFPFAGFLAGRGQLSLLPVVLAGVGGALLGALFWYGLGYLLGRANLKVLIERHGKRFHLHFRDIEKAETWFERYEGLAVFFGRLIPLVRTFVSVPAGFVQMPLLGFLLLSFAGSFIWIGGLATGGALLGERWEEITGLIENYELVVGAVLVLLVLLLLPRFLRHIHR